MADALHAFRACQLLSQSIRPSIQGQLRDNGCLRICHLSAWRLDVAVSWSDLGRRRTRRDLFVPFLTASGCLNQ